MAAVRPEFRAGVLVFDPADPVFGGAACRVRWLRPDGAAGGMCDGHRARWVRPGGLIPARSPPRTRRPARGSGMRR